MGDKETNRFYSERDLRKYNHVALRCIENFRRELAEGGERLTPDEAATRWVKEGMPQAFEQAYMKLRKGTKDREPLQGRRLELLQDEDFRAHYDLTKKLHAQAA